MSSVTSCLLDHTIQGVRDRDTWLLAKAARFFPAHGSFFQRGRDRLHRNVVLVLITPSIYHPSPPLRRCSPPSGDNRSRFHWH